MIHGELWRLQSVRELNPTFREGAKKRLRETLAKTYDGKKRRSMMGEALDRAEAEGTLS